MKYLALTLALYFGAAATANATIYTNRAVFEAVIDVTYTETFESLAGIMGSLGPTFTLPTGLTAIAEAAAENEIVVGTPGFPGLTEPYLNPTTGIGVRRIPSPGGPIAVDPLTLDLGGQFQAVGFDYFIDLVRTADIQFDFGRGGAPGSTFFDTLVAQIGTGLSPSGFRGLPETGFLGFVNDGNPLDVFGPAQFEPLYLLGENVLGHNVIDPGLIDRVVMDVFDGAAGPVIMDNVTVGFLRSTTVSVPEPNTAVLFLFGLIGIMAARRKMRSSGGLRSS